MTDPNRSTGVFQRAQRSPYLSASLRNPAAQGVIALTILGAAVALLVPSLHGGRPVIEPADVGKIAPVDIIVPRTFTYTEVDERATHEKREQAAAAALPVHDYQLDVKDGMLARVRGAFQLVREALSPLDEQLAALEAPAAGQDSAPEPPKPAVSPKETEARRAALAKQRAEVIDAKHNAFFDALDETLTDAELDSLASDGFSNEAESGLTYLLTSAMGYKVVATSRQLEPIVRARAITLRIMRGRAAIDEVTLTSFEDLATVQQASEKVAEKARQGLRNVDPTLRDVLVGIASRMVATNTRHNELETQRRREQARAAVRELVTTTAYQAGQVLVDRGHKIEEEHVEIYRLAFQPAGTTDLAQVVVGLGILLVLFAGALYVFASRAIRKFAPAKRDVLFLGIWALVLLAAARVAATVNPAISEGWPAVSDKTLAYGFFPGVGGAMLVRMVLNSETAIVFAIFLSVLLGMVFGGDVTYTAYLLITGLTGAGAVGHAKTRMEVLSAGVKAGVAGVVAVVCLDLLQGRLLTLGALADAGFAFGFCVAAGAMVTAVVPVVETVFGYTTNIKLLELANLNNPLLRELAIRAPGTFHHSILLGTLVEAGAESIRANPLLTRVGAYYHDVGKTKAPEYFAENQKPNENPHDKLKPSMSALILKDHVKDGVRLLRERGYPAPIADIAEQHVGTTVIRFFYERARKQAEEAGQPPPAETDYRYPGPKPQTREAALVFLADSIEAAARSMPEPTHDRLKGVVHRIINTRFQDGQFEECDLTLQDLHAIAAAFTRVLTGIYHRRPQYPEPKKEEGERGQGKGRGERRANGKGAEAGPEGRGLHDDGGKEGEREDAGPADDEAHEGPPRPKDGPAEGGAAPRRTG